MELNSSYLEHNHKHCVVTSCSQQPYYESKRGECYYHWKVRRGLIEPDIGEYVEMPVIKSDDVQKWQPLILSSANFVFKTSKTINYDDLYQQAMTTLFEVLQEEQQPTALLIIGRLREYVASNSTPITVGRRTFYNNPMEVANAFISLDEVISMEEAEGISYHDLIEDTSPNPEERAIEIEETMKDEFKLECLKSFPELANLGNEQFTVWNLSVLNSKPYRDVDKLTGINYKRVERIKKRLLNMFDQYFAESVKGTIWEKTTASI